MFFSRQQAELDGQRAALLARSALLRGRLADQGQVLQAPLAAADRVRAGWHWLQTHPQQVAMATGAVLVVLLAARPRRALRLAGRLWALWRLWRRLQRWGITARWAAPAESWQNAARRVR